MFAMSKCIALLVLSICSLIYTASAQNANKKSDGLEIHVEHKPSDCIEESAVGDRVEIHYTGKLENGQVFDSSVQKKRDPISLTLGAGQVIEGWEKGLLGMCIGESRNLVVPPHMGYGASGYPPVIPGNAKLLFDVKLIRLEKNSGPSISVVNIVKILAVPAIMCYIIYFMYSRYMKEMEKKRERKKSHKRR